MLFFLVEAVLSGEVSTFSLIVLLDQSTVWWLLDIFRLEMYFTRFWFISKRNIYRLIAKMKTKYVVKDAINLIAPFVVADVVVVVWVDVEVVVDEDVPKV